jgi:FtsP/CotA-like multicopper oxidase with cupredoxin domain
MTQAAISRRKFVASGSALAAISALRPLSLFGAQSSQVLESDLRADYTLTIETKPIELAPKRIVSMTTYNGQFPGPLLRFKEGQRVTVDVRNETDVPEQLHWHGQAVPADVDGAAEEGTPFIPPHGSRRISFVPKPSGFRFYHTHVRAGMTTAAQKRNALARVLP